jgi:DNA-binding winged helix-turn-helix (wHTH) protein
MSFRKPRSTTSPEVWEVSPTMTVFPEKWGRILSGLTNSHWSVVLDAAIGEDAIVLERMIDVHIKSLRKKLGDAGELVETVRGVGYRFHDSRLVGA